MKRLLPVLFVLALICLAAPAIASAETFGALLAQSSALQRGRGFYLDMLKFVPTFLVFLLWAYTTWWVDDDMRELNNLRHAMWNSLVFFVPLLGFLLLWVVPFFLVGFLLLLLCYLFPLMVVQRKLPAAKQHNIIGRLLGGVDQRPARVRL